MTIRILTGDCRERMAELDADSIDSVVCDPPYHLTSIVKRFGSATAAPAKAGATGAFARASRGFMGQTWDGGDVAFDPETWAAVYRVLKPGAHLVAFSGTRTYHRMACAIEDAGFEIRDQLAWVYGSGFPKSHNQPGGWGTALKPAWEPICLARKPLIGTVAGNILTHGTGALNIDGCRIEAEEGANFARPVSHTGIHEGWDRPWKHDPEALARERIKRDEIERKAATLGRWPANIIHDGSDEVLAGFPESDLTRTPRGGTGRGGIWAETEGGAPAGVDYGDSGSAARFFYCAKATTAERGEGNNHPTVKPVDLMRWLVRLVTPKGGTVLDPFMGSGSTLIAADAEQLHAIGCELSPDYAAIAERRIRDAAGMFADVRAA
jgi:site-specific DNA-methyltransferase (adenine-specific)